MQTPQAAIQTSELSKFYSKGKQAALAALNLTVKRGEIFGYLGPNGAGKTTTIRILLDLIRPSSGKATVLGLDTRQNSVEIHRRIGFLPGELSLWENLTGKHIVDYLCGLRGVVDMAYVHQLRERLDLDLSKTVRSYSSGNRRKLGLLIALMHKPELLILDEPTNGLDPLVQQTFHELMHEARQEGRTVFLSSHVLSEVQEICERVAILGEGKLKAVERVADLVRVNFHWVTLRFHEPVDPARLRNVPGVSDVVAENGSDGNLLKFRLSGDIDPVLRAVQDQYIADIHTQDPSLEEIFLTFYSNHKPNGKKTAPEKNGAVGEVVR